MIVGFLGVLLFGGGTSLLISPLFHLQKPQVIITLDGIEDKRFDVGLIEWNEIAYILLAEMRHASLISLILNSPEKYHRRLSKIELLLRKLNGQKKTDDFRIRFALLDTPIEEAWQFIGENVIKPREEKGIHLMP